MPASRGLTWGPGSFINWFPLVCSSPINFFNKISCQKAIHGWRPAAAKQSTCLTYIHMQTSTATDQTMSGLLTAYETREVTNCVACWHLFIFGVMIYNLTGKNSSVMFLGWPDIVLAFSTMKINNEPILARQCMHDINDLF